MHACPYVRLHLPLQVAAVLRDLQAELHRQLEQQQKA